MDIDTVSQPKKSIEQLQIENLPWVEKYRPKSLDDLIAHDGIIGTIQKLIDKNSLPHLLFYGPPGTGKTSTIQATARKLYGDQYSRMVLELNASDDRGIDVVREQIKTFASSMFFFQSSVPYKLIILDEADAMTNHAQTALRRVIEKYTKTTRFCIICNYVVKIIPALQSRCTKFRFSPLPKAAALKRVTDIAAQEHIDITTDAINSIVTLGEGDMRKCLNVLQSASMSNHKKIDREAIYRCTGQPSPKDISNILSSLLDDDYSTAFKNISELKKVKGLSLTDIVKELVPAIFKMNLHNTTLMKLGSALSDIEFNLSNGASDKLQLGSLIGSFAIYRDEETKIKK
ncbi:replication factor C subunit [Tieghemostelium lacteum]|uniref:Replication factor C subunit n=1 Tax=Tieghemostelium lacteum TaxID=361077 RepID=A0A152A5U0_TIELA|nr:replication factor C subunit [Tieghemostelium lacteum]|eukprot:KYR01475.1 replication factor C subunit [Tieghemostelium lacteum]